MPSGVIHTHTTFVLAIAGGLATYLHFHQPLGASLALTGGILAGAVLTPDLDVDEGCISERLIRRTAGRLAAHVWVLFWKPYSLIMPHRSPLSHYPVLGTAVRLLYIAILPALIYYLSYGRLAAPIFPAWLWWSIGGLALADSLHFLMDQVFSLTSSRRRGHR